MLSLPSCINDKLEEKNTVSTETILSDLEIDHLNIWVKDPLKAKELLTNIGFTAVPDSLSSIHLGQGTSGRYFNFLNGYLELIFVYDQKELIQNVEENQLLDFKERANFENNAASPFSIALKMKEYNIEKIPFEKVKYHQDWMKDGASIYSAKRSKIYLKEPSIFVVYPELESDTFESLSDLKSIPDEYDFYRATFKHPNGAQKITNIIIESSDLDATSETIQTINKIENIKIRNGSKHLMYLYFDNNIQEKSFDLRPELPLIIYL